MTWTCYKLIWKLWSRGRRNGKWASTLQNVLSWRFRTRETHRIENVLFCRKHLDQLSSHPYLGVQLDNKHNRGAHITNNISKANPILGLLQRNLWCCPKEVKTTAYTTSVYPVLEYTICAWDPYRRGMINKFEGIQRRVVHFCTGNYKRESSVTQMLVDLEREQLEVRRQRNHLSMIYKIQNVRFWKNIFISKFLLWLVSEETIPNTLRSHLQVRMSTKKLFFTRTSRAWNGLGQHTVSSPSYDSFKQQNTV